MENETKMLVLFLDQPETWNDLTVEMINFAIPPMTNPNPYFLSDGIRVVYLSEEDRAKTENLVCGSAQEAKEVISCKFKPELCAVHPDIDVTNYHCEKTEWLELLLQNPSNQLPQIQNEKALLLWQDGQIVYRPPNVGSQIKVTLKGAKIAVKTDLNSIRVTVSSWDGCYSCSGGSLAKIICHADFGSTLAFVSCPSGLRFSLKCDMEGKPQEVRLYTTHAEIDDQCEAKTISTFTTFRLKAHLTYVPAEKLPGQIEDRSGALHPAATTGPFDFKNLMYLLFEDWIHTGIYVLVFIGSLVLIYGLLRIACCIWCITRKAKIT